MKYSHLAQKSANCQRSWWWNERGLGVVELLVTAAIVISIVSLVGPRIKNGIESQRIQGCLATAVAIQAALDQTADKQTVLNSDNAKKLVECRKTVQDIINNNASLASDPRSDDALKKINTLIQQLENCTVTSVAPSTRPAGVNQSVGITATIPIGKPEQGDDVVATVTADTGETATLTRDAGFNFSGNIVLDGTKLTDEKEVKLTLAPSGTTTVSCQATFTWTKPVPPEVRLDDPPSSVKKGQKFTISWQVKNADDGSVSITGIGDSLPLIGSRQLSIEQDTTFTLTAKRGALSASSNPQTVKVQAEMQAGKFSIQFGSGLADQDVTEDEVVVAGSVTPKPPDGTTVTLGVNGEPVLSVPTSNGIFSGRVALKNKVTRGDLRLTSTGLFVFQCGPTSTPIVIDNEKPRNSLGNVITAGIAVPGGSVESNIATQVVYHAAKVTGGSLYWTGSCPGPPETLSSGYVLRGGSSREIGQVPCGSPCGVRTDCTAESHVRVETTVGTLVADGTWRIDIQP